MDIRIIISVYLCSTYIAVIFLGIVLEIAAIGFVFAKADDTYSKLPSAAAIGNILVQD